MHAKNAQDKKVDSSALHALILIANRLGVDAGYSETKRNYSLPDSEPETRLLIAIARDLGIEARTIKVKFKDLPRLGKSLPAIIRLNGGAALILDGAYVDAKSGPVALIRDPTVRDTKPTPVDQAKLASVWSGEVILLKRRYATTDERQPFGMNWMLGQVIRERRLFIDISFGAIVSTIFALSPPLIFMVVINRVLANHSMSTLQVLAGAILILIVFETSLGHLRRLFVDIAVTRIDGRLNLFLMERLLKLPMDYFEQNPVGRIQSKIAKLWAVRNFVTGQLFGTFLEAVPMLGLIPVMFILDWRLAILVLVLSGIVFLNILIFIKPISRRSGRVILAEQRRSSHLIETLHGMRTIKALAIEGRRRREWDVLAAESMQTRFDLGRMASHPQTFALPFERLIYAAPFCVGAYLAITTVDGTGLNPGMLGAFAMLSMRVGRPLIKVAQIQLDMAEMRGAMTEIASIMNAPTEDSNEGTGLRQPIEGEISFREVRFRYAPDAAYALDGVTFSVPRGTMLGIMGRSGSGKTTITRLLQRLHGNYDGLIKIDGMDLREINLAHLRTNLGVVLQESFLFAGSIRDNIAIARSDATLAQVIRAAQLAGAEEFIERLPRGYDTVLSEGAANLSGGQRQRLAIARALLTDPPVLVLDEATSALDAESEAIINANLRRIAQGRTVISISHRLSMLVDADAILVMERGKVYDIGTHEELLDRCDIYKQLWHQQNRHIERTKKTVAIAAMGKG